jgi:hypothetical protein
VWGQGDKDDEEKIKKGEMMAKRKVKFYWE